MLTVIRKIINSHTAYLHPGVLIGNGEFNAGGNPVIDWHPIQRGLEINSGLMGHFVSMQTTSTVCESSKAYTSLNFSNSLSVIGVNLLHP